MPTPIAVLVGRTNTGKSRLYNALCGRPEALVSDSEHLTRDWRETRVEFAGTGVRLRDTAGLTEAEDKLSRMIEAQTRAQLECADVLLFMVDARSGLLPLDEDFARLIRRTARPVVLIINKMDTIVGRQTWTEFAALGFGRSVHISAERHEGLAELGDAVLNALDEASRLPPPVSGKPRVVAIRKTAAQKAAAARKATGKDVGERTDDGTDGVATNKANANEAMKMEGRGEEATTNKATPKASKGGTGGTPAETEPEETTAPAPDPDSKATKGGTGGTPAETEPEETTAPAPEPEPKASNANEAIKDATTNKATTTEATTTEAAPAAAPAPRSRPGRDGVVYDAGTAPLTLVVCGVSNSGKSTLINRLTRTERLLVHEEQGTTREAVGQQLHMGGREFEIFDTCGFVRRGDILQYLADTKTERLIKRADLALYLIDSTRGATRSDLRKLADLFEAGQNPLVVCSKSDLIDSDARSGLEMALYRQLFKLGFETSPLWLSSLTGVGVRSLPRKLIAVHQELDQHFATNRLTKILLQALRNRPPPTVDSRRIRLRMAHQGGSRPLLIVIHGKQTGQLDQSYRRFLSKTFRNELGLRWSFPRIVLSTDKNPYATPLRR